MNPLKKSYKMFKKTCSPAQLYFILGLIAIIVSLKINVNINSIILNACLLLLWTYLLNVFCNWGWSGLSWFLVLFPYVILLLAIFLLPLAMTEDVKKTKEKHKQKQNKKHPPSMSSIQDNLVRTHRMVHQQDKMNL